MAGKRLTYCQRGHRLSGKNLYVYVGANGRVLRQCVPCQTQRQRLYKRRVRAELPGKYPPASREWYRQYRQEVKLGIRTPKRRRKGRKLVTEPLLDLLQIEGGWWNWREICDRLGANRDSVQKALSRLTKEGKLEQRRLLDRVVEWRYIGR